MGAHARFHGAIAIYVTSKYVHAMLKDGRLDVRVSVECMKSPALIDRGLRPSELDGLCFVCSSQVFCSRCKECRRQLCFKLREYRAADGVSPDQQAPGDGTAKPAGAVSQNTIRHNSLHGASATHVA